ncbi:hypothetical protein [Thermoanaerobacter sp. A7A]|uniref:hypothetical protein n=1 Tax=Thermoanaerobacter sp. A7A TaxID=1350366 RepID=UPI00041B22E2|nr:hypothetical protein [Thermoanaerobacter sp. A7A]
MNVQELKEKLKQAGVIDVYWSIPGHLIPGADWWLEQNNDGTWIMYYQDERGNKDIIKTFTSEKEACEFFYNYVTIRYEKAKPYIGKGKDL